MIDEAILKINPKAVFTISAKKKDKDNIDVCTIEWLEGTPEISKADIKAKINETQYQRDRVKSYPSIQEQLDMQYWDKINGTNNWQDAINAVKAQYPKGN
jgi:hypothetical protein